MPSNAFSALVLAARHGLQRVCVYGVPLIGVNSVSGFVRLQSVQVRTRLIQGTECRFSWTLALRPAPPTGTGPSSGGRRGGVPDHALRIGEQLYETNQPLQTQMKSFKMAARRAMLRQLLVQDGSEIHQVLEVVSQRSADANISARTPANRCASMRVRLYACVPARPSTATLHG